MKQIPVLILVMLLFIPSPGRADSLTEEDQTVQTVNSLKQATVKIQVDADSSGTGFFIAPDTILTNEHVTRSASYRVIVALSDGRKCDAKVGYREESLDLAILHTDCTNNNVLTFTETYKLGQTVVTFGNPMNFDSTASKGIISGSKYGMIQFDAKANKGASGSPVANLSGQVVGILTMKATDSDYMAFAVTSKDINQFLQRSR